MYSCTLRLFFCVSIRIPAGDMVADVNVDGLLKKLG